MTSGPSEDAVGTTAMAASGPPDASTKSRRTVRRPSLSSAPPMMKSAPTADMRSTLRPRRPGCAEVGRTRQDDVMSDASRRLVVIRHSKTEAYATTDHARPLTDRGKRDARNLGRWLDQSEFTPDVLLVSSAARAQ